MLIVTVPFKDLINLLKILIRQFFFHHFSGNPRHDFKMLLKWFFFVM